MTKDKNTMDDLVNKAPEDAEWTAHVKILNGYPPDLRLRNIVQYARSGAFYPADMHVDLIEQIITAKLQEVDRAARTSERDRIFAAMRHVQWLGKDVNSKEIMKVRKEWDKTAAKHVNSLKGGDV